MYFCYLSVIFIYFRCWGEMDKLLCMLTAVNDIVIRKEGNKTLEIDKIMFIKIYIKIHL